MTRPSVSDAPRGLWAWGAAALVGVVIYLLVAPRLLPLAGTGLEISRGEAQAIALEELRALGDLPRDAYVTVGLAGSSLLERRLQLAAVDQAVERIAASVLGRSVVYWRIKVYPRGGRADQWIGHVHLDLQGRPIRLAWRPGQAVSDGPGLDPAAGDFAGEDLTGEELVEAPGDSLSRDEAIARAREVLAAHGLESSTSGGEPEIVRNRSYSTDILTVRFRDAQALLGVDRAYGVEVSFEGDRLLGFDTWLDEGDGRAERESASTQIVSMLRFVSLFLMVPLVAPIFLRRYHEGLLGVRRGLYLFLITSGAGLAYLFLVIGSLAEGNTFGLISRQMTAWLLFAFIFVFQFAMLSLLGLMSWSTGESFARDLWPQKLASFDSLLKLDFQNATIARSAMLGLLASLAGAGTMFGLASAWGHRADAWLTGTFLFGNEIGSPVPALTLLGMLCAYYLPQLIFLLLFLPSWTTRRFGPRFGQAATLVGVVCFAPALVWLPVGMNWFFWAPVSVLTVIVFFRADLLAALMVPLGPIALLWGLPLVNSPNPWFQANMALVLLVLALPALLSVRFLGSRQEFVYAWDDVPAHVRRITERERQRVELDTARNIQSAILPELPPSLHGVELAHSYQPATEVGGDFYDVMALDDGRLAIAVGDVAGHGVSSGLVMSAAKSALAVQATFDPGVRAVFTTLNRLVYQGARRRLLSTLAYALLDPASRRMVYASAGHVFPYRLSASGDLQALESIAYPLGVRETLDIEVRAAKLEPGDSIFLYSDGLVEARAEGSDECFGFDRLEATLRDTAGQPPTRVRDTVLDRVAAFTGQSPREDDVTVLVLRLSD